MIEKGKIEEKVLDLITEAIPAKFRKTEITPEMRLQRDLGLDSIGMLALLFRFEQAFGIDLATIDVELSIGQMQTVGDAFNVSYELLERSETNGDT